MVWFVGGILLVMGMRLTAQTLGRTGAFRWPWWVGGLGFIVVELIAHLGIFLRRRPNVYDGRGCTAMTPPKEIIKLGQIEIRFLLDGDDTAGRMSMFEVLVPPGVKVPAPHYHEHVDEVAYGLEGVLTFTVDGHPHQIGAGDRCFIPRAGCIISSTTEACRRGRWRC